MNALCTLLSIVKARHFVAPLKFLIRGSCAVSFTEEKKKSWKVGILFASALLLVPPFSKPSACSFVKR